jgi:hypothetical protein
MCGLARFFINAQHHACGAKQYSRRCELNYRPRIPAQHASPSRHTVFGSRNEHDGGCDVGMRLIWVGIGFFLGNAEVPREKASVVGVAVVVLVMEVDLSGAHPPSSPGRAAVSSSSSNAALCTC